MLHSYIRKTSSVDNSTISSENPSSTHQTISQLPLPTNNDKLPAMVITQAGHITALGPYSIAREINGILYLSGQIALDHTSQLLNGHALDQFHQIMKNLPTILNQANYQLSDIFKVNIYVTDINTFSQINQAYATYFQKPYPVRTFVEVARLPLGAAIEIEVQAARSYSKLKTK